MPEAGRVSVAVIVPVLNRLGLLRATIESLHAQTMEDAEFILVDDRSEEPVWRYLQSLPEQDRRFTVLRKPDCIPRGCQASRNIGLDASRAEAVVMLDSDDLLAPRCLEERFAVLSANPNADLVIGRQAIFSEDTGDLHWVNVPRPGVGDLDRILLLTHPVDVPWVNGGVMLRTRSLNAAGIRYRPEFIWEDVAFHFECLVAGLHVEWMDYAGTVDAYYRHHSGESMGQRWYGPAGMHSTSRMFLWMCQRLATTNQLTESRRRSLGRSFFHSCLLRSIDAGEYAFFRELVTEAAETGLLTGRDALRLRVYRAGRQAFQQSARITYYWNRFSDKTLLFDFLSDRVSTYNSVVPGAPDARASLEALLGQTIEPVAAES